MTKKLIQAALLKNLHINLVKKKIMQDWEKYILIILEGHCGGKEWAKDYFPISLIRQK